MNERANTKDRQIERLTEALRLFLADSAGWNDTQLKRRYHQYEIERILIGREAIACYPYPSPTQTEGE